MPKTKEYDASELVAIVDDSEVADLDSIGYDQSKTHELQKTLDGTDIWVDGIGEFSGTVAVKATSGNVKNMQAIFSTNRTFKITIEHPESEKRAKTTFDDCKMLDFAPGDFELEGLPVYEGSWEAPKVSYTYSGGDE
jgi:hypothetical protein